MNKLTLSIGSVVHGNYAVIGADAATLEKLAQTRWNSLTPYDDALKSVRAQEQRYLFAARDPTRQLNTTFGQVLVPGKNLEVHVIIPDSVRHLAEQYHNDMEARGIPSAVVRNNTVLSVPDQVVGILYVHSSIEDFLDNSKESVPEYLGKHDRMYRKGDRVYFDAGGHLVTFTPMEASTLSDFTSAVVASIHYDPDSYRGGVRISRRALRMRGAVIEGIEEPDDPFYAERLLLINEVVESFGMAWDKETKTLSRTIVTVKDAIDFNIAVRHLYNDFTFPVGC